MELAQKRRKIARKKLETKCQNWRMLGVRIRLF
jgi:hypothetical protein